MGKVDPFEQFSSPQRGREFAITGEALWNWWQWARQKAIAHHIPPSEADWLLQAIAHLDRLELRLGSFKQREQVWLNVPAATLESLWQQRLIQRVPVQYLVGQVSWREFILRVSPAVLIPRPETELMVDLALELSGVRSQKSEVRGGEEAWADLGTGSGAIALGLATAFPDATIHAVDTSAEALAIAEANAATYHLTERIQFYQGNWLEPLTHLKGQLSGIVSNPPYIPSQQVLELQPEVTQHEPHLALDGGTDGLDCIRHLVATAPEYLRSGGVWLVEMMAGQADSVAALLEANGQYCDIQIHSDLAGIQRFASAYRC
ncbi:MAG: peptide chain release factor N(5)-glutamine methyltransferase [Oscillatoriales cyanobacterium C42_A2020_001]|nr:peptide chain release factor N(5)-glutamine methyltransferase [Leptolyngbyaceae cyanobacterium C42_A2020_001]